MRKTLSLLFVLGLSNFYLLAQTPSETSLSTLFEKANSYPGLNAEKANIEAVKLNTQIIKRDYLPSLDFQAQNTFGTYEGAVGGFFPSSGVFNVSGDGQNNHTTVNTFLSATAKWEFLQFGKHKDAVNLSKIEEEKAENRLELSEIDLHHKITAIYLEWQYNQFMTDWAKRESKRRREILTLSKRLVRSGLSSAADSLAAKTELKQALAQQNKWEAQVYKNRQQLKEYTGLEIEKDDPISTFQNTKNIDFIEENETAHPLLVSKEKQTAQLEIRQKNITHQALPNLSLLAGGLLRGTGFSKNNHAFKDSYELPIQNYLVGIGLIWRIDKFFSKGLKNRKIQHQQDQVREEKQALTQHLDQEESSLENHLNKSAKEIEESEEAYQAAQKSYELFKVRYEKGLIDLTTLLQIQQSLQFAEKSKITAYYNYWQYWNNYAYAKADYSLLTQIFN